MARGERRRTAEQAAKETAPDLALVPLATRVGDALWYVVTLPVRLLLRAADAVHFLP